jgi:acyl-CoA thioesterase-1
MRISGWNISWQLRQLAAMAAVACLLAVAYVPAARALAQTRTLLVVGDSLSAEYGLVRGTGWVSLLSERLKASGSDYIVANASISGETTSGGRARIESLLAQHRPAIVVLELGGNDALRGLSLDLTQRNLAQMTSLARASGARVLLVGMRLPPNYGKAYGDRFAQMYARIAGEQHTGLVPFLLDGIGEDLAMFQPDRIHPTSGAQPRLLDNVWKRLEPMLRTRG